VKAFIDVSRLAGFDYGPDHPLRMERLRLTLNLLKAYGLLKGEGVMVVEPEAASREDLLTFHEDDYIEALEKAGKSLPPENGVAYGLGTPDNPVFPGLYEYALLYGGASLAAAEAVWKHGAVLSFNIAGGLHHAHKDRAAGFCYINDIVLAAQRLLGFYDRVLYVDVDAHHGDGVQGAFWRSNRVLTASFHESGWTLFPGTGFEGEIGEGPGRGFSLNFPFMPGIEEDIYLDCFRMVIGGAVERFKPEAVVAQLGVDGLAGDPLTNLSLSNLFLVRVVEFLLELDLPLVSLGGGGYRIDNVARAWTLAWATMIGVEPPDELPAEYVEARGGEGGSQRLRDHPVDLPDMISESAAEDARRVRKYLLDEVLPLIHARGGAGKE
jgi:acetoin utilization protein AcuC